MSRLDELINWFNPESKVMIALSGGVDSGLVAYAAFQKLKSNTIAVTADYKTLSKEELDTAKDVCKEIGISHIFLDYNELENEDFVKNDSDRCFHCRSELGTHLINLAKEYDVDVIVDGTNIDDLGDFRPGIEALKLHEIKSPLVETNFTKNEIRECAKSVGLSIYDKPSNSCLASRIPWGQRVTAEKLIRIEMGETIVKQLTHLKQVRVRDLNGHAKIEVESNNISLFDNSLLEQLSEKLKVIGFSEVEVDPEGYKPGKINVIVD